MRAKKYIMACVLFCTLLICGSTVIASAEENNEKTMGNIDIRKWSVHILIR